MGIKYVNAKGIITVRYFKRTQQLLQRLLQSKGIKKELYQYSDDFVCKHCPLKKKPYMCMNFEKGLILINTGCCM